MSLGLSFGETHQVGALDAPHRPLEEKNQKSDEYQAIEKVLVGQFLSDWNAEEIDLFLGKLNSAEREKLLQIAESKIPLVTHDSLYKELFVRVYEKLLAEPPTQLVLTLKDPEVFEHPSGAIQLGRVKFQMPNGKGFGSRIPISAGASSGPDLFRISLHGSGDAENYALLNPDSDEILVGYAADLWKRKSEKNVVDAIRAQKKFVHRNINPSELISEACNPDLNGCHPAMYAQWLQVERFPSPEPLNLKKVVMTPKGFSSGAILDAPISRLFGDQGSFGQPYYREWLMNNFNGEISPPHEYRLVRSGNPENESHWTDTGIYTDARQASFPLIGILGEAKEYGRHLGLGADLGGGNSLSYLDKIRLINDNPDSTYFQKVRSNLARPIGSAAALIRETWGLSKDIYHLIW